MKPQPSQSYIAACRDMYELTNPECAKCMAPRGCCNTIACQEAAEFAKEYFGIDLKPDLGKLVPFMGPNGCTLEPHLRPQCTVYTCDIHAQGFKHLDPDWNDRYWELRDKINEELEKL